MHSASQWHCKSLKGKQILHLRVFRLFALFLFHSLMSDPDGFLRLLLLNLEKCIGVTRDDHSTGADFEQQACEGAEVFRERYLGVRLDDRVTHR